MPAQGLTLAEYSPQASPMVVSVVTRGVSDDANALTGDGCMVTFEDIRFEPKRLTDLRDGA